MRVGEPLPPLGRVEEALPPEPERDDEDDDDDESPDGLTAVEPDDEDDDGRASLLLCWASAWLAPPPSSKIAAAAEPRVRRKVSRFVDIGVSCSPISIAPAPVKSLNVMVPQGFLPEAW